MATKHANPKGWQQCVASHRHSSSMMLQHHLPSRFSTCDALPASATEPGFSANCYGKLAQAPLSIKVPYCTRKTG